MEIKKYTIEEAMKQGFIPQDAAEVIKNQKSHFVCGRTQLANGAYLNAETYVTKVTSRFERHERYIDVQIVVAGAELIHLAPVESKFDVIHPYDSEKDIEFMTGKIDDTILLKAGECCIITPDMAHMPCMAVNGQRQVKKIVVKIPIK